MYGSRSPGGRCRGMWGRSSTTRPEARDLRLVFMGTPDFAVPSFRRLAESGHTLAGVVTRPDRPRGRGQRLAPPPVKVAAQGLGVPVLQPESLREASFLARLRGLEADLFAVVAFAILPKAVLQIPKLGSVNVHPSLLPKYRGAAPINWAIIRGEEETGVTVFRLSLRVDAGDMLLQRRVPIGPDETAGALYGRLKVLGADLLLEAVDVLAKGGARPVPQPEEGVTRAPRLEKRDGADRLDGRGRSDPEFDSGNQPLSRGVYTVEGEGSEGPPGGGGGGARRTRRGGPVRWKGGACGGHRWRGAGPAGGAAGREGKDERGGTGAGVSGWGGGETGIGEKQRGVITGGDVRCSSSIRQS